jgi:hypothetical protein
MKKTIAFISIAIILIGLILLRVFYSPLDNNDSIGGTYDSNGCLIPAGYSWNETQQECVREWETQDERYQVNSYQTCIDAGYPILESYPQQCKTPSGRTFTKPLNISLAIKEDFGSKIVYELVGQFTIADLKQDCASRGGTFNECGTVCSPDSEVCIKMCGLTCENI